MARMAPRNLEENSRRKSERLNHGKTRRAAHAKPGPHTTRRCTENAEWCATVLAPLIRFRNPSMSLRQRIEETLLAKFADNERRLTAARDDGQDQALIEKYEALRTVLKPIVTDIVAEHDAAAPQSEQR